MALLKQFLNINSKFLPRSLGIIRNISTTSSNRLKEITETLEKETLTISGINKPAPKEHLLLNEIATCRESDVQFCPVCTLGLDIKHTDVLILSQYVRADGCMLPQRITGLCRKQHKRIGEMVRMAHKAGLMPNLNPEWSKKDPKRRYGYKKFNKYFDENTIKC